ncbi:MAG: MBL fold metallo-hydrolase [Paludibacteraceae bacterium]
MQIIFLGTGTSTGVPQIGCSCEVCSSNDPKDNRLRSSILIRINDMNILIDAGPDMRQQLLTHKVSYLDGILITHEHYDHLGGIDDIRPLGTASIYCEKNVSKSIRRTLHYSFAEKKYPGVPKIELVEITEDDFFLRDIKITPIRVMHAKLPILGFRIGDFAYLTDVKTIPEHSFEKLKGLKVLIINALRQEEHIAHLNVENAISVSEKINAETTYFTHFSHHLGLHKEIEKQLPKNIHLSYDNLSINV